MKAARQIDTRSIRLDNEDLRVLPPHWTLVAVARWERVVVTPSFRRGRPDRPHVMVCQAATVARADRIEPSAEVVARLGATVLALPEAYEEDAWTGIRWRVRAKTFAHVMVAQAGFESSFRDITGVADPTTVLTFRATGDELLALVHAGMPFYKPPWSPTIVGMVIDDDTDWAEVADLVIESYRFCAPQKLVRRLDEAADKAPRTD